MNRKLKGKLLKALLIVILLSFVLSLIPLAMLISY